MKLMQGSERGFTLVEVMVGVLIMGLVGLAAAAAIIQVVNAGRNSTHMSALRQVQTAGYWVSRDGLQAQVVVDNDPATLPIEVDDPATPDTEILILQWTAWRDGAFYEHECVYSLQPMPSGSLKKLQRQETSNDPEWPNPTRTAIVAQSIDGSATSCYWTGEQESFIFEVTATVEQQTESRTYEIKPRPEA
jgi:prepilin-type N-terminal cleavage/methylation domain-containing protein